MARRTIKCASDMERFTVVVVNGDPTDSHAGRSFTEAYDLANPDRGSKVDVYAVCAEDGGIARMPYAYKKGQHLRSFRAKR